MLPPEILVVWMGESAARRRRCRARLFKGRYYVDEPVPVASLNELELKPGTLITFSCPIGFPRSFAEATGIPSFRQGLEFFGKDSFAFFYDIAEIPEQISLRRPFYPLKVENVSHEELAANLGESASALRECEEKTNGAPLFWLVGPKQMGRRSLSLWPVLAEKAPSLALWPFDGPLDTLLTRNKPVIAEYNYGRLINLMNLDVLAKRPTGARGAMGIQVFERIRDVDVQTVRKTLLNGYGPSAAGEEEWDVLFSTIVLAHLFTNNRIGEPPEQARDTEGWMLGL